ncbi:MAG TPA: ABC transporter substrate-binding protein, partial [Kiritimatiellia bacterium]|nr:ABC transporter substrate-binding protein [Kiritimatiellia bacterium]
MRGRLTPWLLILWLAGCRGGEDAAVPFPAEPSRIVCASPAVAEIVFALGAGDRVAAVADFTDWPPEAAEKPRIGGALSPSRERILALQADLILSQGRSEALAALAREHRIAFFSLPLDTLSDVRAAIAGCAARLNAEERGRRLLCEFDAGLAALPRREPVPVLIALGHSPGDLSGLMTTGAGTFLHDIVELAGGRNVFKDVPLPWPRISRESLLRRAPALVLDIQAVALDDTRRAAL